MCAQLHGQAGDAAASDLADGPQNGHQAGHFDADAWLHKESMIPHHILADRHLTLGARHVYLVLLSFMYGNKTAAWPSFATLQQCAGISRPTLAAALAQLEMAGYLTIDRTKGRLNRYSLTAARRLRAVTSSKTEPHQFRKRTAPVQKPDPNQSMESEKGIKGAAHAAQDDETGVYDAVSARLAQKEQRARDGYARSLEGRP